jgi:hypothetical protein
MQCNAMQYNTIHYNTIQYNTIQYNTIQYNTQQYNTIDNIYLARNMMRIFENFRTTLVLRVVVSVK